MDRCHACFYKKQLSFNVYAELSAKLNVSLIAIRKQCYQLCLYRMLLEYWTDEQIMFLKKHYKKMGDKELAIVFNLLWEKEKRWTWKHIEKKRMYLRLKRSAAQINKIRMRNIKRGCWSSMTTWLTRGAAPVGDIRIWKGGWKTKTGVAEYAFKVIKTETGFVHYAHWLYEQSFGKIPAGFVIGFKDRNNMNVVINNLETITRAEHARRNSNNKYPENVKSCIKLINDLKNKVYEHEKQLRDRRSA